MAAACLAGESWHYRTWGEPRHPALMLLHGFTGSHASWEPLAERWSDSFFVVAPDLPGHGLTPAPADPSLLSMDASADRIADLLDHLSIDKAAVLGYSMGGRLALHVALQHSLRLSALILESASPGLAATAERKLRQASDNKLADAIESRGLDWFVPYWAEQPLFKGQPEALRRRENRIRSGQTSEGLAQSLRGAGTGAQRSLWGQLSSLTLPVLIIAGGDDAKFCAIAERMALLIPNNTRVSVTHAGHTVHGEQPDRFHVLVQEFLDRWASGPIHKEGLKDGL